MLIIRYTVFFDAGPPGIKGERGKDGDKGEIVSWYFFIYFSTVKLHSIRYRSFGYVYARINIIYTHCVLYSIIRIIKLSTSFKAIAIRSI